MGELSRHLSGLLDREALSDLLGSGSKLLVAVSGGADSVALLLALHAYKLETATSPIELCAVHVNHNLRPESASEARFVIDLCQRLDIPIHVSSLHLGEKPGGVSPEEFWRRHRYESFARAISETAAQFIALGHNLDDLAETFLFHLVRGTGINGLTFSFFKKSDGLAIIRPLWKTSRNAIEAALNIIGQPYLSDPSNQDIRYSRNRIRQEVMPVLRSINPQVADAIFRASQAIHTNSKSDALDLFNATTELPLSILRNNLSGASLIIHGFIRRITGQAPGDRQVTQAVNMVSSNKTGTVSLGGNHTLVITQNLLWVTLSDQPDQFQLAVAHSRHFRALVVSLDQVVTLKAGNHPLQALNGDTINLTISREVVLRNRLPGDRFGGRPLKKELIDCQVPWYLRDYLLIVEDEGEIVQIIGACPKLNNTLQRKHQKPLPVTVIS